MGYQPSTRCREYKEASVGRRRSYRCRECGLKFQEERLTPLPKSERICHHCTNGYSYTFTDKITGKDRTVKASDSELATLRAWKINPNLTFKIPQPTEV